jgi:cell division protein FtsL
MSDGLLVDVRPDENSSESATDSAENQQIGGLQRLEKIVWVLLITHLLVGAVFILHVLAFHGVI